MKSNVKIAIIDTIAIIVSFMLGASYVLPGRSESMHNLTKSGKLITVGDTLIYYNEDSLSETELLSLSVLSGVYKNVFIVDKDEDEQI